MGKISKYSNIYSTDGELLRHVDENTGKLKKYTTEELEQLLDKLGEDKDENGEIKDKTAFLNVQQMLMQYYWKYGNPHEEEIKAKLEEYAKQHGLEDQVNKAMEELKTAVEESTGEEIKDTVMDEYVNYEEINDEPEGNTVDAAA